MISVKIHHNLHENRIYSPCKENMIYFWGVCVLFFTSTFSLMGETHIDWVEARGRGMGGATLALSSQHNPSSLLFLGEKVRINLSYENRYGMKEFSTFNLGGDLKIHSLRAGAQFSYFGYEKYNEFASRFYASCKVHPQIGLSVRVQYIHLYYSRAEGGDGFLSADMFGTWKCSEKVWCALGVYSLAKTELNKESNSYSMLPFKLGIGVSYLITQELIVCLQVMGEENEKITFCGGGEYIFQEKFSFRLGFESNPLKPTFGIGYRCNSSLRIDFAVDYHNTLAQH